MKKSILSVLLLSALLILASCEPEIKHEHTWGEWTVSKAATCTEDGLSIRKCTSCGEQDEEMQTIKALGHSLSEKGTVTKKATCVAEGEESFPCTREGCDYKETKVIAATGEHIYGEELTKEATCTEAGKTYKVCSGCNAESVISTIAAKGHTLKEQKTEPATCTTAGKTYKICSVCNEEYDATTIEAKGHTYSGYEKEEDGHYQTCTVCKAKTDKSPHSFGEWTTETEPTETTEGKKYITCSTCGYKEEGTIPKKNHVCVESSNYGHNETNHWIKCTDTTCNEKLKETSHTLTETTKAATCTEDGEKTSKCSICGYEKKETINKLDHDWDEGKITTEPTCKDTGVKTYTCKREGCTAKKTETVSSTPDKHNLKEVTKAATCTTAGESYKLCSVCEGKYDIVTIAAKGHTLKEQKTESATCTAAGRTYKVCSVCSEEYDIATIASTGHNWGDWTTKTAGICTTPAKLTRSCSKCSATEEKDGDKVSTAHPADSLTWVSDTVSFLTKTEKKEHCTACNTDTGDTKTEYDSVEGYWVSDAISVSDGEYNYTFYLYLSMDNEGTAVMISASPDTGKMLSYYPQSYTYEWVYDSSDSSKRTGIILKEGDNSNSETYKISEDNSNDECKLTLTKEDTSNGETVTTSYTLTRKSKEQHSEHTYTEKAEYDNAYQHYKITNCSDSFHETFYIAESHNMENNECKDCGYVRPLEIPLFVYQITNGSVASEATWSFYRHKIDRKTTLYPTETYSFTYYNDDGSEYTAKIVGIVKWKTLDSSGEKEYSISDSTPIDIKDQTTLYVYYSTDKTE